MKKHMLCSLRIFFLVLLILPARSAFCGSATATFAGGCFWCMEDVFDHAEGVISATSGFAGGGAQPPTYNDVSAGKTGFLESVQVVYDTDKISYEKLLELYWKNIDPTDDRGQFCDRGAQYRSAIFYHDEQQKALAEKSKLDAETSLHQPVLTPVLQATPFFTAEAGHQDFWKKNPFQYKQYKMRCGRDRRLRELWKEGDRK